MSPKRPFDVPQSGAQKKRQRMREQRTIPVSGAAGRAGGSVASGNSGLPPTIEVEKFAQARAFEISAMHRAMKAAKEAGTQRAFQSLPRHLRRRAASHNIRRLPLRLRQRALAEVPKDAAKPKRVSRKMLGKHRLRKKPGMKAQMFLHRQQKNIWLETHVWHAKRMHMTEMWGHRLAEKPTAKAFRSSYRASQHGAVVHDASYYQYFELEGPFCDLVKVLEAVCDPAAPLPSSKRFSTGAREYTTDVYDATAKYPHGLLGPVTFIWEPLHSTSSSCAFGSAASTSTAQSPSSSRKLLIRAHPALASSAAQSFSSALLSLSIIHSVSLKKHDRAFLTFEITGKRATEVVKKCMKVVKGTDHVTKSAWRALNVQEGPAGVPQGMVFGLEVYDPRLSFPPTLDPSDTDLSSTPSESLLPKPQVAHVPKFWSSEARARIARPSFKKQELDARRSQNLLPGTRLDPLAQDDRIPILLAQRTLSSSPSTTSSPTSSAAPSRHDASHDSSLYGWTLTVPSGWGMPFFSSLAFSTPRVGGLRERSQQHYESGAALFPQDYVGSPAFDEWETRRQDGEKGYWQRRPPAKRPSYHKLGTQWPWRVEMNSVLKVACGGMVADSKEGEAFLVPSNVAEAVLAGAAQTSFKGDADSTMPSEPVSSRDRAAELARALKHEWVLASSSPSASPPRPASSSLSHAMVRVKLVPVLRGVPQELGLVYEVQSEAQAKQVWEDLERAARRRGREGVATGEWEGAEDSCARPSHENLIGRVTTGGFALSAGHGTATAVISLCRLLAMSQRSGTHLRRLVLYRNRDSETYRAATVELMH
ncbi:hypothetical protein JCM11251_001826 [Rhodosporidiobolus azoricus]